MNSYKSCAISISTMQDVCMIEGFHGIECWPLARTMSECAAPMRTIIYCGKGVLCRDTGRPPSSFGVDDALNPEWNTSVPLVTNNLDFVSHALMYHDAGLHAVVVVARCPYDIIETETVCRRANKKLIVFVDRMAANSRELEDTIAPLCAPLKKAERKKEEIMVAPLDAVSVDWCSVAHFIHSGIPGFAAVLPHSQAKHAWALLTALDQERMFPAICGRGGSGTVCFSALPPHELGAPCEIHDPRCAISKPQSCWLTDSSDLLKTILVENDTPIRLVVVVPTTLLEVAEAVCAVNAAKSELRHRHTDDSCWLLVLHDSSLVDGPDLHQFMRALFGRFTYNPFFAHH